MQKLPTPKRMNLWRRFRSWISRNWQNLHPSPPVRKGAAISLAIAVLILTVLSGMYMRLGLPKVFNPILGILFYLMMAALIGLGFFLLLKVLFILPRFLTLFGVVVFGLFLYILTNFPVPDAVFVALLIVFAEALLGSVLIRLFKGRFRSSN